jgi:hypothetical protein
MSKHDELPEVEWTKERRETFRRKRRGKNLVLLAALVAFVALVYVVALVRMGGG